LKRGEWRTGSRVPGDAASPKAFLADRPMKKDAPVVKRQRNPRERFAM
jgi:hypothetical protein